MADTKISADPAATSLNDADIFPIVQSSTNKSIAQSVLKTIYLLHSLATAANDFLVASGSGTFVKKTLSETLTILGKATASGLASLDGSSKVVQDPANATATVTASKIPIADANGRLNKWTVSPRVQSVTSSATVTPDADADDMVTITAQAEGLTLANPTGSPTQGQKLIIRIKDNATARAISYGTAYRNMGATKPTTTVLSKTVYLGLIYNSTDSKWDLVALAQEA